MTIFTKTETGEEKEKKEKEVPKVVVSASTPDEERHISNCGWVPMEGGNFDRPKEKRSSSFGPLSVIRLSPSPLARTPSPTPPEYENSENERLRRCSRYMLMFFILITLGLGLGFFFYQRALIKSAYNKGVYHGWNAATFNNKGIPERLEQNVEISPEEAYEKIQVPKFGSNRPAIFLHDFKQNMTAIVDVMSKRCFLKYLNKVTVSSPKNLIDMLKGLEESSSSNATGSRVVRETFRVGSPLSQKEVMNIGSFMISRHCAYRPSYMLEKTGERTEAARLKRDVEADYLEKLEFASMGSDNVELDVIIF